MSRLAIQTLDTAAPEAKERLAAVKKANGFVPNLLGVLANAPTALETYQTVGAINGRGSLSATEVEVVQITAAVRNGCDFCVAGHTKLSLDPVRMPKELGEALRTTHAPSDPKLQALAVSTPAVMERRGQGSDDERSALLDAGYTGQQVLEVVLGARLASLCTSGNNAAQTEINPELQPYAPD